MFVNELICNRFDQKTTQEWLDIFEGSGLPYGPINNMQEVFSDPQVRICWKKTCI